MKNKNDMNMMMYNGNNETKHLKAWLYRYCLAFSEFFHINNGLKFIEDGQLVDIKKGDYFIFLGTGKVGLFRKVLPPLEKETAVILTNERGQLESIELFNFHSEEDYALKAFNQAMKTSIAANERGKNWSYRMGQVSALVITPMNSDEEE